MIDTYRCDDAVPNLTLEAQICLAQLGTFLTELSYLCALWEIGYQGVGEHARRRVGLTDLRTTSMIWPNMASTL